MPGLGGKGQTIAHSSGAKPDACTTMSQDQHQHAAGSMSIAQDLEDAFNSMLRTDYIPLSDTNKLNLLADYYVDYMESVNQILGPTDQLIVGRRGTGKTTLLYRGLVECMRSWGSDETIARKRTLGVYLDLEKCQSLSSSTTADYESFEYAFVAELCDAIREELHRSWPTLKQEPNLIEKVFRSAQTKKASAVNAELLRLVEVLQTGLPRFVDRSAPTERREHVSSSSTGKSKVGMSVNPAHPNVEMEMGSDKTSLFETETRHQEQVTYRLSVADLLRVIGELRKAGDIPYFLIFIDEFSALNAELQGRFTTLLKKILGNHAGVYVKLCAITDNYRLGSSIILQRDLFELSLDLDAFVERSGSITSAMEHLERLTRQIVEQRIAVYAHIATERLFDSPDDAYRELTRSAMGVPRTIGIVLKQAWSRSRSGTSSRIRIRRTDLEYGVRYASKAYLNQMTGAARDGLAIPEHVPEIWDALIERATYERRKSDSPASHFMIVPRYEERLRFLNMFFLVHLLEQGRTTKKESVNRSLYSFDYGITQENNLGWGDDKNVIRQQRFVYDDCLADFDRFYRGTEAQKYRCPECNTLYEESELTFSGGVLKFCPSDKADLELLARGHPVSGFTEEEIKIIGAIRSARKRDTLVARQVADDVGCYIQKVAKFGEKLNREGVIDRSKPEDLWKTYLLRL